jgi:hypothetical protein
MPLRSRLIPLTALITAVTTALNTSVLTRQLEVALAVAEEYIQPPTILVAATAMLEAEWYAELSNEIRLALTTSENVALPAVATAEEGTSALSPGDEEAESDVAAEMEPERLSGNGASGTVNPSPRPRDAIIR